MNRKVDERIKKISTVIFDVDGVLTNGKINVDHRGEEFKMYDVTDGLGIVLLRKAGYMTGIISARGANTVKERAADLGIDVVKLNAFPKLAAYEELKAELEVDDEQICFIGDDIVDLCLMKRVGFGVAVANAADELKDIAHYVTKNRGGEGAVRELIELILKSHGKWDDIIKEMSQ